MRRIEDLASFFSGIVPFYKGGFIVVFAVLFGPQIGVCAAAVGTPAEQVRAMLEPQLKILDNRRSMHWMRQGDRVRIGIQIRSHGMKYDSAVGVIDGGGCEMPMEVAFDGQTVTARPMYGMFHDNVPASAYKKTMSSPIDELENTALGWILSPKTWAKSYNLEPNEAAVRENGDVVLVWIEIGTNAKKEVVFAKQLNYWPIEVNYVSLDGATRSAVDSWKYGRKSVDGNVVFFPLAFNVNAELLSPSGEKIHSLIQYGVYSGKFEIDPEVSPSQFQLTPWPFEQVMDRQSQKYTPAPDPNWNPRGKVSFPTSVMADALVLASQGDWKPEETILSTVGIDIGKNSTYEVISLKSPIVQDSPEQTNSESVEAPAEKVGYLKWLIILLIGGATAFFLVRMGRKGTASSS